MMKWSIINRNQIMPTLLGQRTCAIILILKYGNSNAYWKIIMITNSSTKSLEGSVQSTTTTTKYPNRQNNVLSNKPVYCYHYHYYYYFIFIRSIICVYLSFVYLFISICVYSFYPAVAHFLIFHLYFSTL